MIHATDVPVEGSLHPVNPAEIASTRFALAYTELLLTFPVQSARQCEEFRRKFLIQHFAFSSPEKS